MFAESFVMVIDVLVKLRGIVYDKREEGGCEGKGQAVVNLLLTGM